MSRSRSRSPKQSDPLKLEFQEHIVGDAPGRVYIDLKMTAHNQHGQVGYALALYDRSSKHFILADVRIDIPWRGKGLCSKLVERLFRLAGERYQVRTFAIDVRPPPGSDTGPRACACYINALRRAFQGRIRKLTMEFESGKLLSDDRAEVAACQAGNLVIDGELV